MDLRSIALSRQYGLLSFAETRRDVLGFGTFVDGEMDLGENGFVGDRRDVIFEATLKSNDNGLVVKESFAAEFGEERFDFAWGEKVRNGIAERIKAGLVKLETVIRGDGLQEGEAFFGRGGGKERNLQVDAAGALEIYFDKIRTAGGKDPNDTAAVFLVRHFLREHGVDTTGDSGFAAAGIAAAE